MKQALDILKTHTVALACGVVALLAIIAFFVYPVPGLFAELEGEVVAREDTNKALAAQLGEARTLPSLDPKTAEPQPLTPFPTTPVIAAAADAIKLLKGQSASVLAEAVELNAKGARLNGKDLLVPDSLPKPSPLARQKFFDDYNNVTKQTGEGSQAGVIHTVLHGTLPSTSEDVQAVGDARAQDITSAKLISDASGRATNQPEVDAEITRMRSNLPLELRLGRAQQNQIYVNPGAVEVQPELRSKTSANQITAIDIFNAQYSLWLQTTLFAAIADANAGAKNVLDAPVKHLVQMTVPMNIVDASAGAAMGSGFGAPTEDPAAQAPVELKADASATLTPNHASDPLGYAPNSMFDPIECKLVLRVDFRRLPEVLAKLSRDHFVKIRNVSYRTVESGVALQQGFLYDADGKTPLVEVALDCDVLVLREWVIKYMPDPVKKFFSTRGTAPVAG